jgi:hypothetical protein
VDVGGRFTQLRAGGAAGGGPMIVPDTEEVTGSIPVSPTRISAGHRLATGQPVTSRSRYPLTVGAKWEHKIIYLCRATSRLRQRRIPAFPKVIA